MFSNLMLYSWAAGFGALSLANALTTRMVAKKIFYIAAYFFFIGVGVFGKDYTQTEPQTIIQSEVSDNVEVSP